jgi:CheY-like chemotaxis protein
MISGDATQLHQVLMNLSVNARDAMPDGGVLTLTAENVRLDESFASSAPDAKAGPYVLLEVSDTGTGISPDILDKIFDPFFTTKSPDRGTGLGLSTVTGIVKGHGGFMQVFSQVGKGSKFNVYLPAAEVQLAPPRTESVTLPRGSGELILVIDDEEGVCEIIRKTLGKNGYQVLTAKDGAQGIAAYDANRANVKLVLVDLAMPVMNGEVTIRALKDLNPQVRCIVASGLAMPANPALLSQLGACGFLQKPFTSEALLRIIHQGLQEQVP